MIFSSNEFIFVFLPLALGAYLVLSRLALFRTAMVGTILFSIFFYAFWNPRYVLLLGGLMVANYAIGKYLLSATRWRKPALAAGVTMNLTVLGYFKYTDFLISTADRMFDWQAPLQHIALPLAISFFTFQKIAFLCDVYSGKISRLSFLDYSLFVLFFPQLIAGPIVHYRELQPQFDHIKVNGPRIEGIVQGVGFFLIGLFKKVVIADSIAHYATPLFDQAAQGHALTLWPAWLAALAYTCQLYFDFSGYSDMAIGLARMFGIRLPFNFNSPYKARSIIDFWRRWHMTLSAFLRDYLYIPLGGNRHGKLQRYRNLMITMLLGGLWHGAGWTFVAWGGLHGIYLVINQLWRDYVPFSKVLQRGPYARAYAAACLGLTFFAVVLAWVFFRAGSFFAAAIVLEGMAGLGGLEAFTPVLATKYALVGGLCALAMMAPNSQEIIDGDALSFPRWVTYMALGTAGYVAVMLLRAPAEFIYFRF